MIKSNKCPTPYINSSEQGLKRRKVIRTVKNGIIDKDLNEQKMPMLLVDIKKNLHFIFL